MATKRWIGSAENTAHIITITVGGTWVAGETAIITIGGSQLILTVGTTVTTTQIAADVVDMINGEDANGDESRNTIGPDVPQWTGIDAEVSGSTVVITSSDKGRPFIAVASETSAAGTFVGVTTQQATGQNWWDNDENWSDGSIPATGDTIIIDESTISILYGIDQNLDVFARTEIGSRFTGDIGLPEQNDNGYGEYLPTYLNLESTDIVIGTGDGPGTALIKLDTDTNLIGMTIYLASLVIWKGTNVSSTITQDSSGELRIAPAGDETAQFATLTHGGSGSSSFGTGVTIPTINQSAGSVLVEDNNITTYTQSGGESECKGTMTVVTLTITGGTMAYRSSGTITTLNLGDGDGATFNASLDNATRTITTLNFKREAVLLAIKDNLTIGTFNLDTAVTNLNS